MQRFFELDKNSFSRYLGRNLCLLAKLSHSKFTKDYYVINDTVPLKVQWITFEPFPFDLILPSQTEQQGTQIVFSNINNIVANEIKKTVNSNENIIIQLFIANIESETVEIFDKGEFEVYTPTITNESVTGNINLRHSFNINCGSIRYNRQLFPNLFL